MAARAQPYLSRASSLEMPWELDHLDQNHLVHEMYLGSSWHCGAFVFGEARCHAVGAKMAPSVDSIVDSPSCHILANQVHRMLVEAEVAEVWSAPDARTSDRNMLAKAADKLGNAGLNVFSSACISCTSMAHSRVLS